MKLDFKKNTKRSMVANAVNSGIRLPGAHHRNDVAANIRTGMHSGAMPPP